VLRLNTVRLPLTEWDFVEIWMKASSKESKVVIPVCHPFAGEMVEVSLVMMDIRACGKRWN
jgi:hypothetical protein